MKTKTLIFTTLFFSFLRVSGQDTIYFNELWKKTTKDRAYYYRLQTRDSTGFSVADYYINGNIQMTGFSTSVDSLFKEGPYNYYDENGKLSSRGNYKNNHKTGEWNTYYPGGQLKYKMNFKNNGKLDGDALYYYPDGRLKRSEKYADGVKITGKCFTLAGKDTTYYALHEMPEFRGGDKKRIRYLKYNVEYPEEAKERGIQGIVYVSFVVAADGKIEDVKIEKGVCKLLDNEVIDVVKHMPKWKPGRFDGKPVRAQFTMPVSFRLN